MTETSDIVVAQRTQPAELVPVDQEIETGAFVLVLRHRWQTMLLVTMIAGTASCLAVWFLVHPKYEVSATMHVAPVVPPILFSDTDTDISRQYGVHMATQARVIV
ncbi:MAG: hypothetical protein WBE26_05670, partial [Phycisphaerae bacterium]